MARTKQTSTKVRMDRLLQSGISQTAFKTPTQSTRPQLATKRAEKSQLAHETSHKKIRRENGALALLEIKKYQKSVNLLIPRRAFHRLVREIAMNFMPDVLFKAEAIGTLQEATEMYLCSIFEESNLICLHSGRVTLMAKDIRLLKRIRGTESVLPDLY